MTHCLICKQEVSVLPGQRVLTDCSWDEEICYPHDDPDKRHVTKGYLVNVAAHAGANRPSDVANAMEVLLWYWHNAPDNAIERDAIDRISSVLRRRRPRYYVNIRGFLEVRDRP